MTEKEQKLLEIAKEVISMNKDLDARLTGSLMLAVMEINKRREASDIDIICSALCEQSEGFPLVPKVFYANNIDGSRSAVNAIQFMNEEGLKIEFMASDEGMEEFNGVLCGEFEYLIIAKQSYMKNDSSEESRTKHKLDLEYLFENNKNLI